MGTAPPVVPPAPDYRVVGRSPGGEEIRKFADAGIAASIDRVLAGLSLDKRIAVVAAANLQGATGAVMVRIGGSWSFVATVNRAWKGALGAEAAVKWSR